MPEISLKITLNILGMKWAVWLLSFQAMSYPVLFFSKSEAVIGVITSLAGDTSVTVTPGALSHSSVRSYVISRL